MQFEKILIYPEAILPTKVTEISGGYNLYSATDIFIPSIFTIFNEMSNISNDYIELSKENNTNIIENILRDHPNLYPTAVPTGIRIINQENNQNFEIEPNLYLFNRSWVLFAGSFEKEKNNDNYNNILNDKNHIFIQLINLSPFPFLIKKGDKIAQGYIRQNYLIKEE